MPRGYSANYANADCWNRRTKDVYGDSTIWINEINSNNMVNVNGSQMWFPTFNIEKYYPGAKKYVMIEKLENHPITFIDVLYSYRNIWEIFRDDKEMDDFLNIYTRKFINAKTLCIPGILVEPKEEKANKHFRGALVKALQEASDNEKLPIIIDEKKDQYETEDKSYDYKNAKEDGIVLEFIKDFYEVLSNKKIQRPNQPKKITVNRTSSRKVAIMKSGCTIIDGEPVGKYCFNYYSKLKEENIRADRDGNYSVINDETQSQLITIFIAGIDDRCILSCKPETEKRLKKLGETLFSSKIIETFLNICSNELLMASDDPDKKGINLFCGKYNEEKGKIEIAKKLERCFDRMNDLIDPAKEDPEDERWF